MKNKAINIVHLTSQSFEYSKQSEELTGLIPKT